MGAYSGFLEARKPTTDGRDDGHGYRNRGRAGGLNRETSENITKHAKGEAELNRVIPGKRLGG